MNWRQPFEEVLWQKQHESLVVHVYSSRCIVVNYDIANITIAIVELSFIEPSASRIDQNLYSQHAYPLKCRFIGVTGTFSHLGGESVFR